MWIFESCNSLENWGFLVIFLSSDLTCTSVVVILEHIGKVLVILPEEMKDKTKSCKSTYF